jgi:hypothetical protein
MSSVKGLGCVVALAALALGGCGFLPDGKGPAPSSKAKVTTLKLDAGRETFLLATSRTAGGLFFTRPPYDMNGAWRTEVTCGIYKDAALDESAQAIFGIEADLRGATKIPSEFYGVFARYFTAPPGLQVFASSHGGNHGQVFFDNATSVDLAIETNGTTVTYFARDSALGGAYQTVGTRALATPAGAHQPGIGVFNAAKGATIGFTNFRVPVNGVPAVAVSPEHDAMNAVYAAAFKMLEAVYALDGPVVGDAEVAAATAALDETLTALETAKAKVDGLAKAPPTPKQKAQSQIARMQKAVTNSKTLLGKKGAKAAHQIVKTGTGTLFIAAWKVTDALIPDELRDILPGKGLGK